MLSFEDFHLAYIAIIVIAVVFCPMIVHTHTSITELFNSIFLFSIRNLVLFFFLFDIFSTSTSFYELGMRIPILATFDTLSIRYFRPTSVFSLERGYVILLSFLVCTKQ